MLCRGSEHSKGKVVAVAKYGNGYYYGWNSNKSSPAFLKEFGNGISNARHAEQHVVGKLRDADFKRVKLWVMRWRKSDGAICMARPCYFCQKELREKGFKPRNIMYTTWEGKWERMEKWDDSIG